LSIVFLDLNLRRHFFYIGIRWLPVWVVLREYHPGRSLDLGRCCLRKLLSDYYANCLNRTGKEHCYEGTPIYEYQVSTLGARSYYLKSVGGLPNSLRSMGFWVYRCPWWCIFPKKFWGREFRKTTRSCSSRLVWPLISILSPNIVEKVLYELISALIDVYIYIYICIYS
jgi:hypothetical protein